MHKKIAFIPARGGSKAIPGKNIKEFCGNPLIYWVTSALSKCDIIDEIIVATNSQEIKKTVLDFSLPKIHLFDRSSKNAKDNSSTESVMLEFLNSVNLDENDYFFLVQATSPFTKKEDFENAFNLFKEKKADSLVSCALFKRFLWNNKGNSINYDYKDRPRRQDFEGNLIENGAFYINSVGNILQHKNRLSGNISTYIMPEYTAVELDEEDDWIIAEQLMYKHILQKKLNRLDIKLFLTDVDGVLTDAGMYYSETGDELKKFNTKDGKAFELLRNAGIKTGIITSENTKIVEDRAKKLKVDYLYQGVKDKLAVAKEICKKENITLKQVAYIGDDLNDYELLQNVSLKACPADAVKKIKFTPNIIILHANGGQGVLRELTDNLI